VLNQSVVELLTGETDPAGFVKAITEAADRK
jgi:raffinose/stachyose/melibiose transport system substrate-binding protein